ncbi:Glyoxal oxidase-related protein [Rhynchospora pubera]|uniref:Glyoxal oxidase-related protein n=1 Tax=Rhynchospora pubera TaxID=906938 RepID=A0AAV8FXX2_9POAL|nr:Glyoxal oxidase-related protein [Rhynchospora pubera]
MKRLFISLERGKSMFFLQFLLINFCCFAIADQGRGGTWNLLLNSSGVVAMHMVVTYHDTVIMFDQTGAGPSGLQLGECNRDSDPTCWAHSVEYDIASNSIRPMVLKTDTWCSSGAFLSNGTLVQTGGHGDGARRIRYFRPCSNGHCWWHESHEALSNDRWYATNQILPETDRVFVIGGLNALTYEFVPKSSPNEGAFNMQFLHETRDRREEGDNLYPFVHLMPDGNLFIFANRESILFDYNNHNVVKHFPRIPGEGARSYPSTGSSVMLPLTYEDGFSRVEVLICGGSASGAYEAARRGDMYQALRTCARMVLTDENPEWSVEEMPGPRVMNDMILLPTSDVLIINGASHGCAGWDHADRPVLHPYLYKPYQTNGSRFTVLQRSNIPRMYHSSAVLLPDGRVFVAGSNPNRRYLFDARFPTELRVETFSPHYTDPFYDFKRAQNVTVKFNHTHLGIRYGEEFLVQFDLARRPDVLEFNAYAPPFTTHSLSMGQRLLKLQCTNFTRHVDGRMRASVVAPPSPVVAPSGYYMFTVVNGGIPSAAKWIRFIQG